MQNSNRTRKFSNTQSAIAIVDNQDQRIVRHNSARDYAAHHNVKFGATETLPLQIEFNRRLRK